MPVRYDRDLMSTTLKAMKRVAEIRARRERVFYKNRMAGKEEREKADNVREVQRHIELIKAPSDRVKARVVRIIEPTQQQMDLDS
ncbi:10793_t:CDS:2 [Paraglomus brasilianum]|uniref:10793_t:CDS:1 n=1 Tax=Paraglomus brasilianum TaxID=144538 RepID=A0A9N9F9A9_9GLOM|nr:10793_t:CDS:2 [Paraglomus brasilianum]